jgi:DNA processing protein
MAELTERAALVALLRLGGRTWSSIAEDVEDSGSALSVLESAPPIQTTLFGDDQHAADRAVREAERDILAWKNEGMSLVTVLDPEYPAQLLTIHQRPPFLMFMGDLQPGEANGVAVVGTRKPSPRGLRQATELAEGLADRGVPVISGLAAGIDTAALEGALRQNGRTVAVIGTGLRRAYPAQNASLQRQISEVGLLLSQFWPDAPPTKSSFPMRNAVMSGYAAATVVVEAAWRSGARMQARLALEHGRPVFLLASLLEHDWARDYAARPGATVVTGPDEVLRRLEEITSPADELVWAK